MRSYLAPSVLVLLSNLFLVGAADASVYIGNPSLTVLVAPGSNIVFDSVTLDRAVPRLNACSPPPALNGGSPAELMGDFLSLPIDACAIGIETGDLVTIEGHGTAGGTFTLELNVGDLVRTLQTSEEMWVNTSVSKAFILELASPNWVSASGLGLVSGQHVTIDSGSGLYSTLVGDIQYDSSLFRDSDGDGVLQSSERSAGALD